MRYIVFDLEADGLLEEVTKIHCLSYEVLSSIGEVLSQGSFINPTKQQLETLFGEEDLKVVGHNIARYDLPVLRKLLGLSVNREIIDTLALSWYTWPNRVKHGLESHGESEGVPKPVIKDWKNLTAQEYVLRCETDVVINRKMFVRILNYLFILYNGDDKKIAQLMNYLTYKLLCAQEQEEEENKLLMDIPLIKRSLDYLYHERDGRIERLKEVMPLKIEYSVKTPPAKMYKKDGTLTALAEKWLMLLEERNLPLTYTGEVLVEKSRSAGNPASKVQLKDWLYSLGWVPETFEHRKNSEGEIKAIPQIYDGTEVCRSIKRLYDVEPELENLNLLSLVNHRISVFEGFLSTTNDNNLAAATIAGFTNTLRFKHSKPIVNLPKPGKYFGEEIRASIIAKEGTVICGSDMSALEDTTKQHYMYNYDPEYVLQMRVPGFDPHLDIAVLSGILTKEQAEDHKNGVADYSKERSKAKTVNFAGIYGAGAPKIAQSTGMSLEEAKKLHKTYWDRNKSVKQVAKDAKHKTVKFQGESQMWLLNPISGFWYSLRTEKDKFSTLNQGTGVFCFDMFVREVRNSGIKLSMQYHDEILFYLPIGQEEEVRNTLQKCITRVNGRLNLNVPLGISMLFGKNYAETH